MNDPRRLLDPASGAPVARSLLRVGVDMGPPPGQKEQIWGTLSVAIGAAAVAAAAGAVGNAAAAVNAAGAAGAVTVPPAPPIPPAAPSLPASPLVPAVPPAAAPPPAMPPAVPPLGAPATLGSKLGPLKLIAGKWILLSGLALTAVGAAAYGSSTRSTTRPAASADDVAPTALDAKVEPKDDVVVPSGVSTNGVSTNGVSTRVSPSDVGPERTIAASSLAPSLSPDPRAETTRAESARGGDVPKKPDAAASQGGVQPVSKPAPVADPSAEPKSSNLAEESAALAGARGRAQNGDAAGAVQALLDMDKRFGSGGLAQERTALLIQALAQSGQRDAAARYADAFLAAYPSSPLSARIRPFASP